MYDFVIVGGGIIGLSTGMTLGQRYPKARILLLEKESSLASHQTGRNSGVIHSGIYYRPGSLKARFARTGRESMVEFCKNHGIEHEICGKVIVATDRRELPFLENLHQRGLANGLTISKISPGELREVEPHANGLAAIRVPCAGIVNFRQVAETFSGIIREQGGELRLATKVEMIARSNGHLVIESKRETFSARFLINCAGLHCDRVAGLMGVQTRMKIVPFRGEYYELKPQRRHLVKNLLYPVPNPEFPFLGVHFTRMIGGGVHAGPNAVLALKREGYAKTDFDLKDFVEVATYPAFWKLAKRNWKEGAKEMIRSFSRRTFVRSLQRLIPEVLSGDLMPTHAGVRAQALMDDGRLEDDFLIIPGYRSIHVCNAPSPAATASIPIGSAIVDRIPEQH